MSRENNRIAGIDTLRAIGILCVVMCHSVEGDIYTLNLEGMNGLSLVSKIFAFTMFSIGRLGVPLFLLISGYLLLDKE